MSRRNSASTVWLFDPEAMVLGDIVLERGTNAASAIIAGATGGRYSHALIWVGGDFVEAMPDGVRNLSFARVPVRIPKNWLLLRPKPEHLEAAKGATDHARNMVFKDYDASGAVRTVFGARKGAVPTSRFCSQLVAEAYQRAGLKLLPGKSPEMVTPNMLAKSVAHSPHPLPLVPSTRFQKGPYPAEMLDRSASFRASAMRHEFEIAQALFQSVEPLVRSLPLPPGYDGGRPGDFGDVLDLLPWLAPEVSWPIADRLLMGMEATNYFHLLEPAMADLWFRVGPTPHWQGQVAGWEETRQRHLRNAMASGERGMAMPHPIWMKLRVLYFNNASAFEGLIAKAGGLR